MKRCGNCNIRFYCSSECQKIHWRQHKSECKQTQENAKALMCADQQLDLNHPFEAMVAAFYSTPFSELSCRNACDCAMDFLVDTSTKELNRDFSLFSDLGFMRLTTFSIKALTAFPENSEIIQKHLNLIVLYMNYLIIKTLENGVRGVIRLDLLFRAGMMEPVVESIRLHIGIMKIAQLGWFILAELSMVDHSKYLQALARAGVVELAITSLRVQARDADACLCITRTMSNFAEQINAKEMTVPNLLEQPLALSIIVAMKRHRFHSEMQAECCLFLHRALMGPSDASYVPMLIALGAFEATVDAMSRLPTDNTVVHPGAIILDYLCVQYFADTSKPKNTSASLALVSSLPHFYDFFDAPAWEWITSAILDINIASAASEKKFVCPGYGIRILAVLLKKCQGDAVVIGNVSAIIANVIRHATHQWGRAEQEYGYLLLSLKPELLQLLNQCLQKHMNCGRSVLVDNIVTAAWYVTMTISANVKASTLSATLALVEEATQLYPADENIQQRGGWFQREYTVGASN